MTKPRYYSLEEALDLIEEPNRRKCRLVLVQNKKIFNIARGSTRNHQAWEGGYIDHVTDTMNLAVLFYDSLSSTRRPLDFSFSDSLLVMFLHDLEKPFKELEGKKLALVDSTGKKDRQAIKEFRERLFSKYGFQLTNRHLNAIRYVEGENEDYTPKRRVMNELAAFCHMCDVWSARGWYDFPKKEGDNWR